jgi:hypothetical protein
MLQQLRDPRAVLHIRLPSRDLMDMDGVDQQAREALFQHVEHRFPQ